MRLEPAATSARQARRFVSETLEKWGDPTLVDLATHTAGLPFMPDNLTALMELPAARYSKTELYGFIASRPSANDIGAKWAYSNLDYWLLQEVIAARAGADFGQTLQS